MMLPSRWQTGGRFGNKVGVFYAASIIGLSLLAGAVTFVLRLRVGPLRSEVLVSVILSGISGLLFYLHMTGRKHNHHPLNRLTDAGFIAVYCWNRKGKITYANRAALKMLGRQAGEIAALRLQDIIVPIEGAVAPECNSKFGTKTFIGHLIRRHDRPLLVFSGTTQLSSGREEYVGFAIDISKGNGAHPAHELQGQHDTRSEAARDLCATILLVEDQQALRELLKEVLNSAGFRVLEAEDGKHAVEIAAGYGGTIDLMLTDWVMPRMDGGDAAGRVRQKRPGIKVVYMSGYSEEVVKNGLPSPHELFLEKPVRPDVLISSIRTVLNNQTTISSNGKVRAA